LLETDQTLGRQGSPTLYEVMMFRATGEYDRPYLLFVRENEVESTELKCPCGMILSPVAPGEIITYDEHGTRLVFDIAYGCLPNGVTVIGVIDKASDCFPQEDRLTARLLLDPYTEDDEVQVESVVLTLIIPEEEGHCAMCGSELEEEECETEDSDPS
jgi:hypothetical protein